MIKSWNQVQHTPSTAYTGYSKYPVQHTLSTVHTELSIHPGLFLCPSCLWWRVDPWMWLPLPSCLHIKLIAISQLSMRVQCASHLVTFPRLGVNYLTNWVSASGAPSIDCPQILLQSPTIRALKCITKLARSQPKSASLRSLHHGCRVNLNVHLITSSKLARTWVPNSLDYSLQVRTIIPSQLHLHTGSIMASRFISKLARSPLRSASLSSLDCSFQIRSVTASKLVWLWPPKCHVRSHSITASMFARLWPPSGSPNSINHSLVVHLWVHWIVIFMCTINCSQALPTASPDIPCVDGSLYRYIDT